MEELIHMAQSGYHRSKFGKILVRIAKFFVPPPKLEDIVSFIEDNYSVDFDNKSRELLRQNVLYAMKKYEILNKGILNILPKVVGLIGLAYSTFHLIMHTPIEDFIYSYQLIMLFKTLIEIPELIIYIFKSKDFFSILCFIFSKFLAFYFPVLGTIYDYNIVPRIVRRRVIRESYKGFLSSRKS